jgi:putative membrane protein
MNAVSAATAAALLAAAATMAVAQTQSQTPTQSGANPGAASSPHQHQAMKEASSADTDKAMTEGATPATFVKSAAEDGMTEVELGKLAMEKSQNNQVKQFAQKMVHDHTEANHELESIARSKGLPLPTKPDAKHEAMVKNLSALSGAAFDSAYAEHMAKGHSEAVAMFQGASRSSDRDLAEFAQKTLPTLEEHKQLADNLHANTKARTASAQ